MSYFFCFMMFHEMKGLVVTGNKGVTNGEKKE